MNARLRSLTAAALGIGLMLGATHLANAQSNVLPFPHDEGDGPPSVIGSIFKYPVNRIADFFDIFSGNLGFGFGLHLNVHATRLMQLGFGASTTSEIGGSGTKREWGVFQETRAEFSFLLLSAEKFSQHGSIGSVSDYSTATDFDRFYRAKRDLLGFGGDVTIGIISLGFEFHPVEVVDFLAGILTLDFMHDDL